MGAQISKTASRNVGKLLETKGVRVRFSALRELAELLEGFCPWVEGMSRMDLKSWEKVGKALEKNKVDGFPLRLWGMVLDILKENEQKGVHSGKYISLTASELTGDSSPADSYSTAAEVGQDSLDSSSTDSEESQTSSISSQTSTDLVGTVAEKIQLSVRTKHGTCPYRRQRVLYKTVPSQSREHFQSGSRLAGKEKDSYLITEEEVSPRARGSGQGDFHSITHPAAERRSQSDDMHRYYQVFDVKFIKKLKGAVEKYGPSSPFTQALINNIMDYGLLPQEWKILCKAVLSSGDYLLWISEWRELSRKIAMQNAQTDNPEWTLDMLVGEGPFEGSTRAWCKLPAKGVDGTSLTSVRQGPEEPFQNFIARLQETVSRNAYTEGPLISQLAFENANAACKSILLPHKGQTDISGYIRPCVDMGPAYYQSAAVAAAVQETPAPRGLACRHNNRRCFKCGSFNHFKCECPDRASTAG
ncbi:endogenous retrovirus group K member 6 Gag polyprotein-like [Mastomys coucha]|uniref:endogenous retrovirus group K member 6 Gag polyprotein-like n=1 Tax=Mastomys coucha TaxID=35658 RepID=UPI00126185A7|nr:endogenous retrovirus group K member 6 Gag polyprotein-like [Mastomys coucha]